MRYNDEWVAPWRLGQPQALCTGDGCTYGGTHSGTLVIASTLDAEGLCANCGRTVDDSRQQLRIEAP